MKVFGLILFYTFLSIASIAQGQNENSKSKVKIAGVFNAGFNIFHSNSQFKLRDPFNYVISGNPVLTIGKLRIPVGFSLSNFEDINKQSLNKIGLSPDFGWGKVHLGFRNVSFSNYSLSNKTFLGAGFEINPGLLRAGFIYGRFQRAVKYDTTRLYYGQFPAYDQRGYVAKLGIGKKRSYFDLIFLNIYDDESSLAFKPDTPYVPPGENAIVAINSRVQIGGSIFWTGEAAVSLLTRDLRAPEFELGDLPEQLKRVTDIIPINSSSSAQTAFKSALQYKTKSFSIGTSYERVDPEYQSFGAYFFNNDIERITLNPSFYLLKRKVRFSSRLGWQRRNVNELIAKSTFRTAMLFNGFYMPNNDWQINASYSNLLSRQEVNRQLMSDTVEISYVNQNANFIVSRRIKVGNKQHTVRISGGLNDYSSDLNSTNTRALRTGLTYSLRLTDLSLNISPTVRFYALSNEFFDQNNMQYSLMVTKMLLDKKLRINLNNIVFTNSIDGDLVRTSYQLIVGSSYSLAKAHSLTLNYRLLLLNPADAQLANSYQSFGGVMYRLNLWALNSKKS